jgi:hypothetical protein
MDRNAEIAKALADALGKRLYEAHCEWVMNVFCSGQHGVVFADWYEMKPGEKCPYVELAQRALEDDHLAKLTKRIGQ